jgi:nucleoside 2-deoxyribosyltransferase
LILVLFTNYEDQEVQVLIYFAGPLFCQAERTFNQQLTDKLEMAGFCVFLPQRDGVEKDKPPYNTMTKEERRRALFHLDKAQILACDIFLFILDGRVPDEGACVELGMAYCQKELMQAQKLLIGLQTDMRAAFPGSKLNPMVRVPLDCILSDEETLLSVLQYYREQGTLSGYSPAL